MRKGCEKIGEIENKELFVCEQKEKELQIERKEGQVFGIYEIDEDYAVSDGSNLYYLFSGISFIDEDVLIGIPSKAKLTDYILYITPELWMIIDASTHKIIKSGRAIGNFFNTAKIFKDKLLGL